MDDNQSEEKIISQDPLTLDIKDNDLVEVIEKKIKFNKAEFEDKHNLKDRREKNEKYYKGEQVDVDQLKDYEGK